MRAWRGAHLFQSNWRDSKTDSHVKRFALALLLTLASLRLIQPFAFDSVWLPKADSIIAVTANDDRGNYSNPASLSPPRQLRLACRHHQRSRLHCDARGSFTAPNFA